MLHPPKATWDDDLRGGDPLRFDGYRPPAEESVVTGRTEHYAFVAGRFEVLGGSMGAVHGERVVRAYRRARDERLPVVVVASSGGARMQEGMVSLVQMARTAAASRLHAAAGLLQLAVLRQPTTGGVYASYASLADVRCASPGATIGFAGPRVVELTTGQRLPEGANTAEFAFDNGLVDALVAPDAQAAWVDAALGLAHTPLLADVPAGGVHRADGDAWSEVLAARHPARPSGPALLAALGVSWTELRGPGTAFRCGLATLAGRRIGVVAMTRAQPTAADYRLAQRTVALAGRLGLPVLTLIDTPGADPRPASEAAGVAGEIARTFAAMAECPTPTVAVCIGEGGSGGALALGGADRLLIEEHAIFSVIAPEGAAAILERDASKAPQLARRLRLTARDLLELGIVDAVVPERLVDLEKAVLAALDEAEVGDRHERFDRATRRWLST